MRNKRDRNVPGPVNKNLRRWRRAIEKRLWKLVEQGGVATNAGPPQLSLSTSAQGRLPPTDKGKGKSQFPPFQRFGKPEYGGSGDPILFSARPAIVEGFNLSVAVHLHLYYMSMDAEFIGYLQNIPVPFDLFISVPEGAEDQKALEARFADGLPNVKLIYVRAVANVGRDIYPFAVVFGPTLLAYDLVLHVHSKKSAQAKIEGWRRYLLHHTLGSRSVVTEILNRFARKADLGAIFPPYFPALGGQPKWSVNKPLVDWVLEVLDHAAPTDECPDYPAGSFFWIRPSALHPLLSGKLSEQDFGLEAGLFDGTPAHAIERLFGVLPRSLGYDVEVPYVDLDFRLVNWITNGRVSAGMTVKEFERDRSGDIAAYRRAVANRPGGKGRIAMVTAILGPFDALLLPEILEDNVDYFCFSDTIVDGYGVFQLYKPPFFAADPRRSARYIKTNLLKFIKGYDQVVWIDANVLLRAKLQDLVQRVTDAGAVVGVIPHPTRNNILEEAAEVERLRLDDPELIESMMARYVDTPAVGDDRLIESNVLVLDARSTGLRKAMQIWWNEINTYSVRDQLSLNYALVTAGVARQALLLEGRSTRDSDEFLLFEHGLNQWWPGRHIYAFWHTPSKEVVRDIEADAIVTVANVGADVDVVICVHNALADVQACLASLDSQLRPGIQIIIVDDASDAETAGYLVSYVARTGATLIRHDTRLGYTKAANSGVVRGKGRNVLLLNSDTIMPIHGLAKLGLALDSHEFLGIVGPLSNAASTQSVPSIRSTQNQTAINALPHGMTVDEIDAEFERNWTGEIARVPLVHGFCFMVRRSVFESVGLFDEVNFPNGYGEENDFCFRVSDAGYDLGVLTNTFVYHAKSKSYSDDERVRLMKDGSAALAQKHTVARVSRAVATMVAQPQLVEARRLARRLYLRDGKSANEVVLLPSLTSAGRPAGSAFIRLILPYSQQGLDSDRLLTYVTDERLPSRPEGGTTALLQRTQQRHKLNDLQGWLLQWRNDGNSLIYDLDDDLFDLSGVTDRTRSKAVLETAVFVEWFCRAADVVTVSTEQLKQVVQQFSDRVHVVPNALDAKLWRLDAPMAPRHEGPVRIGYYGTPTHDRDLELVASVMRRLQKEFGSAIDVEIIGAFSGRMAPFGKSVQPPDSAYPEFVEWLLDHHAWDIGLIPLVDDRFNSSKSNLKFLEFAALGAATVVSDVSAYRGVARDGENCLVVGPDAKDWYRAIRRLIVDRDVRRRLAEQVRADVQSYRTDRQLALYKDVLNAAQMG